MTGGDTFSRLVRILSDDVGLKAELSEDTALIADLGMDSLAFTHYLTEVESQFEVKISDDDVKNHQLGVIRNMVAYLEKRTGSARTGGSS